MVTSIDHIAIISPDLDTAIYNFTALGFTVVPGGEHPGLGSHNALIAFADGSYIELIAFKSPVQHPWYAFLQLGGGLIDYCAATDNLAEDRAAFRQLGVGFSESVAMGRTRPDGYRLDWVVAAPDPAYQGVVPFLIEDNTPRSERVPQGIQHANGAVGIDTLTIVVHDTQDVDQWFQGILKQPSQPVTRPDLDGAGVRFAIGGHQVEFVTPASATSPLYEPLQGQRGAGTYAVSLKTTGISTRLDETLALNARLSLVSVS